MHNFVIRRVAATLIAMLMMTLAACGGVKAVGGTTAGDAIAIGTTDKVNMLDPAGTYEMGSFAVFVQIYPFLYSQNYGSADMSPDIAADNGTWSKDGTEFTAKLKGGLRFANGHDLTASDVKFSFDRMKRIDSANGPLPLLANIESVAAPDPTTVVFRDSVRNDVTLKQVLGSPAGPIVDEQSFDADRLTQDAAIVNADAFAGPYRLSAFKLNDSATYERNPAYRGLAQARNDIVQVKYFADSANLKLAVQQGQVDVAYRTLTPTDIEDLRGGAGNVRVVAGPGGEERYLVFNMRLMPYGSSRADADPAKALAVRKAMADLVDRPALARDVYKGTYEPLYSFIPNGLAGHEDTLKTAYGDGRGGPSLSKAGKTLHEAGVKTPVRLAIQYNTDHYGPTSADEYAAVKAQLENGGLFFVDLQQTEWTQYTKDRVVTGTSDGNYPVYQLGWLPDYSDPDNYLSPFFRDDNYPANGYRNERINELLIRQAGEQDRRRRAELLGQVQELETADLSTLPLLQGSQVAVVGRNVHGVTLDASFRFRYAPITKD
ncbi:peptide ABC transporter substrate-binding protein [Bifidobacterium primatium]|uniref:Peptide ABC transporter substrate-binding protein n=1 Tax=Bifidobacterium primatium TaxID=2045438 RepID=A0A2M9H770_9BIFI|nr:ABC transporter substrate-binding protein [Bifidobacterium primatium]PJM72653.1 peptide ABC transporter substrate-binding protein [Bifidobacterium primatium]